MLLGRGIQGQPARGAGDDDGQAGACLDRSGLPLQRRDEALNGGSDAELPAAGAQRGDHAAVAEQVGTGDEPGVGAEEEGGPAPQPSIEALVGDLAAIEARFVEMLGASTVVDTDPNRGHYGSGLVFVGYATWGWGPSDGAGEAARMKLLGLVRGFRPRFQLLFPHSTPEVVERHARALLPDDRLPVRLVVDTNTLID